MKTNAPLHPALANAAMLARLMDGQFRIPGTDIRFGFDAIIGLIPGAGDFASFCISGYLVMILAKNGASGFVLARMVGNIAIDGLIGSIPLVGDLFDIGFKANQRNLKLMKEHFVEGRHSGGAWKLVVPLLILLLAGLIGIIWLLYQCVYWLIHSSSHNFLK